MYGNVNGCCTVKKRVSENVWDVLGQVGLEGVQCYLKYIDDIQYGSCMEVINLKVSDFRTLLILEGCTHFQTFFL